jgi:hypothetical protein
MNGNHILRAMTVSAAIACLGSNVLAGWSSDPAQNLPIADRPQEQGYPLMGPTTDGGCYIAWFDDAEDGYDVRLQRLDKMGNELWPHNGIMVADRDYNSTEHYSMVVDAEDNALLSYRQELSGATQIVAQKVSPDGDLLWGDGVQLSTGIGYATLPRITTTSDGHVVVAWTFEPSLQIQRLDADGVPTWDSPVTLTDDGGGYFWCSDITESLDGGFILTWRRDGPMYWDPKYLWAQRFSAEGDPLWGDSPLVVFDDSSVPMGHYPKFVPDGSGGVVFYICSGTPVQCHVTHVSADGEELFGHNGVVAATTPNRTRLTPHACYNPAGNETILFWIEYWVDPNFIGYWGVYGQLFNAAGDRQWTDNGLVLMPLETIERDRPQVIGCGDGAMVFWSSETDFEEDCLMGARVDRAGEPVWDDSVVLVSSRPSNKSKLAAMRNADGHAFLAWGDGQYDMSDIFAQNVTSNGTLGAKLGDIDGDGDVDTADLLALLAAWGPCEGCPEDLNGDGLVNTSDLLTLLANWG